MTQVSSGMSTLLLRSRQLSKKISLENISVKTLPILLLLHVEGFGGTRMIGAEFFRVQNTDGSRTSDAEEYEKADEKTFKEFLADTISVGRELLDGGQPPRDILHWTVMR